VAQLARIMDRLPQVLRNVRVARRDSLETAERLWDEVAEIEAQLGETGRVLLRPSGTEPVVRVMVEAASSEQAEAAVVRLCDAVVRELGGA
jgi:phosphoglucosamine mutase